MSAGSASSGVTARTTAFPFPRRLALAVGLVVLLAAVTLASIPGQQPSPSNPAAPLPVTPPPLTITHTDIYGETFTQAAPTPGREDRDAAAAQPPLPAASAHDSGWQELTVRKGDSLSVLLTRAGIGREELDRLLRAHPDTRLFRQLLPGQALRLRLAAPGLIDELHYRIQGGETLHIQRIGADRKPPAVFQVTRELDSVETRLAYASGQIEASLFVDGQNAGLSDNVIVQLAEIFGWDIDFSHDLRVGDRFSVVYEERHVSGQRLADGPISAAEFVSQGRVHRAIGYRSGTERMTYYSPDGLSLRRPFLRSPLKFSRITSGFSYNRFHPILKSRGAHTGVDYGAPHGTPVLATSSGRVQFVGERGGYGSAVILRHGGSYSTLYAHLSQFARGIQAGAAVEQGQVIGYVGATGLATGPHLHYEFQVGGAHKNPLTFRFPLTDPVPSQHREDFLRHARHWSARLDLLSVNAVAVR